MDNLDLADRRSVGLDGAEGKIIFTEPLRCPHRSPPFLQYGANYSQIRLGLKLPKLGVEICSGIVKLAGDVGDLFDLLLIAL